MSKEGKKVGPTEEPRRLTPRELSTETKKDIDAAFFEADSRLYELDKREYVRLTEFAKPIFSAEEVKIQLTDPQVVLRDEGRWYLQILAERKRWDEENPKPPSNLN